MLSDLLYVFDVGDDDDDDDDHDDGDAAGQVKPAIHPRVKCRKLKMLLLLMMIM